MQLLRLLSSDVPHILALPAEMQLPAAALRHWLCDGARPSSSTTCNTRERNMQHA